MKVKFVLIMVICFAVAANAQTAENVKIPAEVQQFVEKGTTPLALESADLNGDGLKDYILILQKESPTQTDEYDYPEDQRPLLVITRGKDKNLTVAKRNERMVMCSQCGGIFGDPFAGVTVGKNTFTVNHYGGSAWRWTADYKFNYSRIDKTWQLVKIEKTSYHNVRPMKETLEKTVLTPPKDYGKIDITDFDPTDFEENAEESAENPDNLISPNSAGKVKLGMTVAEVRQAVKPMTLSRTRDGEGVALIAVKSGEDTFMTLFAGEEDSESAIDDKAKVEFIEVWDSSYKTTEGVHPKMKVGKVVEKYGKVKEIIISEIEAREFADFVNQPKGLQFRLMSENGMGGIYKNNQMKTTEYSADASIFSIQVVGTGTNFDEKTSGNSKVLDVGKFNEKIEKASSANESWIKMPMMVIANILEPFNQMKSRNIEIVAPFADVHDSLKIIVVDDGYADDSVRGEKFEFELKKRTNGIWKVVSAQKSQRCWEDRGHQDYSTEPCL